MSAAATITARFDVRYAGFHLRARLALPGRGVTVLFGHSGSGKTTLLRAMAGLEHHPDGYLAVNGETWQDDSKGIFVPTHQRALGYVFQEASLFPHLSVRDNIDYGRRRAGAAPPQVDLPHVAELLGIGPLLDRRPDRLSGGERQRVAIARALLRAPKLLLMDEPLAALDLKRKQEILPYLERLHAELAIPIVYVTHSPDEMARLADHVVLLDSGTVIANGSLFDTLARLDLPVALVNDPGVVIEGVVEAVDASYQLMCVAFAGGSVRVAHDRQVVGERLRLRIMARDVSLTLAPQMNTSVLNQLCAQVLEASSEELAHVMIRLDVGGTPMLARITRRSRDDLGLAPGKKVWIQVKAAAVLTR
ncbi:MAG: molybdenum ABC transporter ATP-binding protein [Pseudomonadota bacterium]